MPDNLESNGSLFIEGLITDDPEIPTYIKISRSIPFELIYHGAGNLDQYYIDDAEVFILCDDGTDYELTYDGDGIYKFNEFDLIGEPGKSYMTIIYFDGEEFESSMELLRSSPIIDSLGYKVDEKKIYDDGTTASGYTFHVSTHGNSDEDSFYRWMLDVTYSFSIPYESDYIWQYRLVPFDNSDITNCWKSKSIPNIFIASTEGLTSNDIIEKPLHFESQLGKELSERYYLHVNQLSISRKAYYFWKDLDKLINQTDGLYQTQPFNLVGNIECKTNNSYQVIGIFEAAGTSEYEKYFDSPTEFPVDSYPSCNLEQVGTDAFPWLLVETYAIIVEIGTEYYTADITCFDCTIGGGTNEKPAFWEY